MRSILQVYGCDLFAKGLLSAAAILLIRYMTAAEYARYTFVIAVVGVISQTVSASVNRVYVLGHERLSIEMKGQQFLGLQLWVIVLGALVCSCFGLAVSALFWISVVGILATCFSEFAKTYYQSRMQFRHFCAIEVGRAGLYVSALVPLALAAGSGLYAWQVMLIQSLSMLLVFVVALRKQLQLADFVWITHAARLAWRLITGNHRYVFGYFLLLAVLLQIDAFILHSLGDEVELATFGSASRYYMVLLLALNAVHAVVLPLLKDIHVVENVRAFLSAHQKMLLAFVPVVLLCAVLSGWVLPWVDMGKYPAAVLTFRILAVSAIVSFAFSPYVNVLMSVEDFRFLVLLAAFALIAKIAWNVILIQRFGAVGPAITTLFITGGMNACVCLRARRHLSPILALARGTA